WGNSMVQFLLTLGFFLAFASGCLSWPVTLLFRWLRPSLARAASPRGVVGGLAWALCMLNLLLLVGLFVLVRQVSDPIRPACTPPLRFLPLGGNLSAVLAVVLTIILVQTWRYDEGAKIGRRPLAVAIAGICFVPFLFYWNLLGRPL